MKAIFKKELRSFLFSTKACIFSAANLLFVGFFAYVYNFYWQKPRIELVVSLMTLISALSLPIVTSSIFSRDRKNNTEKLIFSLPVSSRGIMFGKYLATVALHLPIVLVLLILPVIFSASVAVNFATSLTSVLGYILFICAVSAIFLFIASVCKKGYVAAIISYTATLVFFIAGMIPMPYTTSPLSHVISAVKSLAMFEKLDHLVFGFFDISTIIYYLSITVFFLFLTLLFLKRRRNEPYAKPSKLVTGVGAMGLAALLIIINIVPALLPSYAVRYDISSNKAFSISEETKRFLGALDTDVTINVLNADSSNNQAEYVISLFDEYSEHVSVNYTSSEALTDELLAIGWDGTTAIPAYSLYISSDKRATFLSEQNAYSYYNANFGSMDASTYEYNLNLFYQYYQYAAMYGEDPTIYYDALVSLQYESIRYYELESMMLSYIEYVALDILPSIYYIGGLSESGDTSSFEAILESIGCKKLDISNASNIPNDTGCLVLVTPERDVTDKEKALISDYLGNGGGLVLITDEENVKMQNLMSVMKDYGVTAQEGIVAIDEVLAEDTSTEDSEAGEYNKYLVTPIVNDSHDSLYQLAGQSMTFGYTSNLSIASALPSSVIVTKLLTTTADAYIDGVNDSEGEKVLGVAIEKPTENGVTEIVWFTGGKTFTNDFPSPNANTLYAVIDAISWSHDSYTSSIGMISPVLLTEEALTVSASTSVTICLIISVIIPSIITVISVVFRRKRNTRKPVIIE